MFFFFFFCFAWSQVKSMYSEQYLVSWLWYFIYLHGIRSLPLGFVAHYVVNRHNMLSGTYHTNGRDVRYSETNEISSQCPVMSGSGKSYHWWWVVANSTNWQMYQHLLNIVKVNMMSRSFHFKNKLNTIKWIFSPSENISSNIFYMRLGLNWSDKKISTVYLP